MFVDMVAIKNDQFSNLYIKVLIETQLSNILAYSSWNKFLDRIYFFTDAQKEDKLFRKDYNYIEKFESFYKIHTIPQSWFDAKRVCALEGATLWHPDSDDEAQELLSFWRKTKPNVEWMLTGLSDLLVRDVFQTVDGTYNIQLTHHQLIAVHCWT